MSTKELRNEARKAHTAGTYNELSELYRKLLREASQASDATNLGSLLRAVGRLEEAVSLYKEWINAFQNDLTLRLNAINSAIEKGYTNKVINGSTKDLIYPQSWELEKAKARTLIREGNFSESIKILEADYPHKIQMMRNLDGYCTRVTIIWRSGIVHSDALNRVLTPNPNNPRIYCNILSIYKTTGQWEKQKVCSKCWIMT